VSAKRITVGCLLIAGLRTTLAFSASSWFERSVELYHQGRYADAVLLLQERSAGDKANPEATQAALLLTRTYVQLGEIDKARRMAEDFLQRYPSSRYLEWIHFELGRIAYQQRDLAVALLHFIWILDHSKNPHLNGASEDHLLAIMNSGVNEQFLLAVSGQLHAPLVQRWLPLWTARIYYGVNRPTEAKALLQKMNNAELSEKQLLLVQEWQRSPEQLRYPIRIGIALPLTGDYSQEGRQFLSGFVYGLQEQRQNLDLIIKDTKGSLVEAVRQMSELLKSDASVIIGEIDGNRSAALAGQAAQTDKLFISPISTDNGIAGLGNRIFQMNSDMDTRGAALARYAFEKLGMRTFATLAPADEYGQALTDAFTSAVDKLGGAIIAQQWYYPGTEDFKRHFQAIRETALRVSEPDTALINQFLRRKKELAESGQRVLGTQDDEFEIPIRSIDGFFFPIYEEDLAYIAPQYALVNIQSTPLGGDNWNHPEILRNQRRYLAGAVFISGQFIQDTDMEYIRFKNGYRISVGQSPTVLSVLGYDLAGLLKEAIGSSHPATQAMMHSLCRASGFRGLAGEYCFLADSRVNQSVHLLRFENGIIQKLEN